MTALDKWLSEVKDLLSRSTVCGFNKEFSTRGTTDLKKAVRIIDSIASSDNDEVANKIAALSDEEVWKCH